MLRMKPVMIAGLVTVLGLAVLSWGQTSRPGREGRARERMERRRGDSSTATTKPGEGERPRGDGSYVLERARQLVDEMKLSDEQKTKVSSIFDKAKEELKSMREEIMGMEPGPRFEKIKGVLEGTREKVAAVLTDAQKGEFQKKMDELRQGARAQAGGGIDRLRESLSKLDLSDDQRAKIKDMFEEVRAKAQQAREEADGKMDEMREKMQPIMQETRDKLKEILSKEQQEKLREMMAERDGPATRPANMGAESGPKGRGKGAERRVAPAKATPSSRAVNRATTAPAVGEASPDLSIKKLDGSTVQLSSYKGRVVVLEFGSYSSPSFRKRAAAMEQLKNQMSAAATFLLVYTKEAHPAGGWEIDRNKDEKISVEPHGSVNDRRAAAMKAREGLKITLPILLDEMDDSVSAGLGAGENSLVIIGRDGTLVARQEWADPTGARRLIEAAAKNSPTTNAVR
jgi:protein CpxP